MHTLAEDDVVAVATLHEGAVDVEAALLQLDTLLELGVVVLRLAPVLLGVGEFELALAVEAVVAFVVAAFVVGDGLAVGGEDEAHGFALGVEVAVHELVPLEEFVLCECGACQEQDRQGQKYLLHYFFVYLY